MSYASGTPERELQDAMQELSSAVEKVARLSGVVEDGYYVSDWAVCGAAVTPGTDDVTMFSLPCRPMPQYVLHGLLDTCDTWIMAGGNDATGDAA